ncbi:MAG TPA: two-component regulator propeller domain-containing protein [Chitinophagaceae bacterium]|nr:two-component regulator propeller domain-containing protein [Chitinophagaceae bacterium]
MRQQLVILILAFFCAVHGVAQTDSYSFSRLDISNGLSNNQVNCFYRDAKGFLWIGTLSGLNRYDGYQFKIFRHDLKDTNSLAENFVSRIVEGPHDKIWVETKTVFSVLDLRTEKVTRNIQASLAELGITGTAVSDIRKRPTGTYWFLMDRQHLWEYDPAAGRAQKVYSAPANEPVASFQFDNNGLCYVLFLSGELIWLDAATARQAGKSDIPGRIFDGTLLTFQIFVDSDNELWIYSQATNPKGVLWMQPQQGTYTLIGKDKGAVRLNNNIVASVVEAAKGEIWIGTDHGGINIYDKASHTMRYVLSREDEVKSLGQNSIVSVYRDDKGYVWVGTYKKGISFYHPGIINLPLYRHHTAGRNSLSYDDVNRFAEDAKGNIWIGTNGGGLNYFNRATNTFTSYVHNPADKNSLSNNVIVSLFIDKKQQLWIGSYYGGLDCFDGKKFIHYRHNPADTNSLSDDRVWEIFEDSRGRMWIGTLGNGLDFFDREKNIFKHYKPYVPNSIRSNYVADFMEDRQGNIWIATSDGLNIMDGQGNFSYYQHQPGKGESISNNNVTAIVQDKRGWIWVGTHDGLNIYTAPGKKSTTLHTKDGLPHNTILTLVEDKNGWIWAGTPNGLTSIMPDSGNSIAGFRFINYDERDGLQGREFNENAVLRTGRGELLFGGAGGFNLFMPPAAKHRGFDAQLVLTSFQVFNKPVTIGEKLDKQVILPQSLAYTDRVVLKHNQNVFSVEFAALDFTNTEKIKYAYRLDGFNNDWLYTDAGQRMATYTNLDAGTYKFRVKAMNSEGVWSEESVPLTIRVQPPFWKTPLAYIIYIVVAAAILYFARRMELQRTRRRYAIEEEKKEARRKHELDLMKIKFFTNVSHEFRTPLSLILAPIDKMLQQNPEAGMRTQVELLQRNAKRLLNLVNQLLDFRKLEEKELKLTPVPGDIISFIHDVSRSFTDIADIKHITFSFRSNEDSFFTRFDHEKIERILFNLLSNAFKFTPPNGHVTVDLQIAAKENHELLIRVTDTGIGIAADKQEKIFERFFQTEVPENMVNQGSGIGLAITREFARLHGGDITVESEPGKGSSFIVSLPLVKEQQPAMPAHSIEEHLHAEGISAVVVKEEKKFTKQPIVLLVEDNDDFRFYLKDNLKEHYHIIEAANGKTGWQKTLAAHPDLVVSDVSMPEMNGIDLCKKIKADKRTSHIPVILLTALTGEEQQLRGLETGANDYMTKPFNFEILQTRIRNQLQQNQVLKKTYQKQVEVKQGEITVVPAADRFLQQVIAEVEKNIAEPGFSVEHLSRSLCMSRVALYKRMLSVTGKSPLEFIRDMRMQKAAMLLEKTELTIAEVAYEVGFNNPKNFSKSFKAVFQVLPSAYRLQKQ